MEKIQQITPENADEFTTTTRYTTLGWGGLDTPSTVHFGSGGSQSAK